MTDGTWFDTLTRALAGGGSRRDFLRLLGGGLAGALATAVLPREGTAAPASQVACTPRPRVTVQANPSTDRLAVIVGATGAGNTLRRVEFGPLRNAVVDVPGVASGVGSGFAFTPPPGSTQVTFLARSTSPSGDVHVPFTVTDDCGPWPTFVGSGTGALRRREIVCPSFEAVLTAPAPAGSTTLQVSNQGCFKVGDELTLDPGGPNEETLVVAGLGPITSAARPGQVSIAATSGPVTTTTPVTKNHPAGEPAVDRPAAAGETCVTYRPLFGCGRGLDCCPSEDAQFTGRCCSIGSCCPTGCCSPNVCCVDEDSPTNGACGTSPNREDCCRLVGFGCPSGSRCCDLEDGQGRKCHPRSAFGNNARNCGRCGNDCARATFAGDRCVDGQCRCGSGPSCVDSASECLRHIDPRVGILCCDFPNVACGPGTSRRCCPESTHYCFGGDRPDSSGQVCCQKGRAACNGGCCPAGSICRGETCITCPCGGDTVNHETNSCGCGSPTGPLCDATKGLRCSNGACVCAASPGYKLARFTCDLDDSIPAYVPKRLECPIEFPTMCRRIAPNPDPSINPEIDCRSSDTCNPGYVKVPELCRTPV